MEQLAALIALSHARWTAPVVEATLGTTDPTSVAKMLAEAVSVAINQSVAGARFYEPGVGIVVGLEVADGRAVVAKVHRQSYVTRERLAAIIRVQADLAASGAPAPLPLGGPIALGNGWLTVEELRESDSADGSDPEVRRGMACALWSFVDRARLHVDQGSLGAWPAEPVLDDLWPEPHDLRFDFEATAHGAAWIDDSARAARSTLTSMTLEPVVGHLDWRVQNLGFAGSQVSAIFDWDSLGLVSEAALVGITSVIHSVDFRLDLPDPLPRLEQIDAFVAEYELASGATLKEQDRTVLTAAQLWIASYGARCQHSDQTLGLFPDGDPSGGWPRLLTELLTRS